MKDDYERFDDAADTAEVLMLAIAIAVFIAVLNWAFG